MLGKTNAVHPGYGDLELITRKIGSSNYVDVQGTVYTPLRGQVLARGGSRRGYRFEVIKYSLPEGLTLSEDGAISGIPLKSGSYQRTIRVTDSEGSTAEAKGRIAILTYEIKWKVTNNKYVYDGKPHTVTLTPINIPDVPGMPEAAKHLVQGVNYKPRYSIPNGYADEVVKPSTYAIFPAMIGDSLGYKAGATGGTLTITASEDYTFNVQSQTVKYDGNPHEIVPEIYSNIVPDDVIEYTTKYRGVNGTTYAETTVPPTNTGSYQVTVQTKRGCYVSKTKYVMLTITE